MPENNFTQTREPAKIARGIQEAGMIMTDEQIYQEAMDEWMGILESLWVAIGKPVDDRRLAIYAKAFSDVPLGLLEKAVKRVQLTTTYQVVPTIAEINKALQVELREANCTDYEDWIYQEWM